MSAKVISPAAASATVRDIAHKKGVRAAVIAMMEGMGFETDGESIGLHIVALAGRCLNRAYREKCDPLNFHSVRSLVKFHQEEKLGTIIRDEDEVRDAIGAFALIELLDGLDKIESQSKGAVH